jgi:hypothetical protein
LNYPNIEIMIWLYCLISFIIGCLAVYLLSQLYIHKVLKREKKSYRNEIRQSVRFWYLKPFPILEVLKKRKDLYREKLDEMENSLRELSRKLEKSDHALIIHQSGLDALEKENLRLRNLTNNSDVLQKSYSSDHNRNDGKKHLKVNLRSGRSTLFFTIPEADGSFYAEKGEPDPDGRKFYRIISAANDETGELHFISGQYDQKAIENIDYYLIPVCEVENISLRNNASKIIQKEAGRVVKISDKWVTDKKIKVKLL